MIVKIRTQETNGWIYLDKVRKIETSRDWVRVKNEDGVGDKPYLNKCMLKIIDPDVVDIGSHISSKEIKPIGTLVINAAVLKHYDYDVDSDLPISDKDNIYTLLVLDVEYESGISETYVMRHNNDVYIINDQGKTIERI